MTNEYGRLMLDIEGKSLSEEDKNIISSSPVGGIIFFSKNFESYEQIKNLINEIKNIK
jgi:beta-N-acetylhexosaminidase